MASVPLFDGRARRNRLAAARAESDASSLQQQDLARQIEWETLDARTAFETAVASLPSARAREAAAAESFRIVEARYREGLFAVVAYLDARDAWTRARLDHALSRFRLFAAAARFERAAALSPSPSRSGVSP